MGGNSFIPASNKKGMGSSTYTYKQIFAELESTLKHNKYAFVIYFYLAFTFVSLTLI